MNIFQAFILGIVEGITEFLPISSTAHLILTADILGLSQTSFQKSFEIIIQLGAILAVIVLYGRSFFDWEVLKRLLVGFIPTGVIGFVLYPVIKTYLLESTSLLLWSLFVGGVILIAFERFHTESTDGEGIGSIPLWQCATVGLVQAVAIVPGVSRSAATIVGGLLLGISRRTIVEYSFLLAVPTMAAATGLDILKNYQEFSGAQLAPLLVGFVTSFIVALAAIRWLLYYVRQHDFTGFGIYRILVAFIFFFWK